MTRVLGGLLVIVLLCNVPSLLIASTSHFTNEWAVQIEGGLENAKQVAKRNGYSLVASVPALDDYYVLESSDVPHRSKRSAHHHTRRLIEDRQVRWAEQQVSKLRVKRTVHFRRNGRADFNDPEFNDQWYLGVIETSKHSKEDNLERSLANGERGDGETQESARSYGSYLRVEEVWKRNISGRGVVVSVLDDGLERTNRDIEANYDPDASYDLNNNDPDPMPRYDPTNENKHGTRCAGEIAMVANNNVCGVGIAFNSRIGGVRMLDGRVTDSLEARALSFNCTYVDIYSASWGPNDDGSTVEMPGKLARRAMEKCIEEGRGGKGVLYAWASGNGGRLDDNCNCDGYTSSIYTISISSASRSGELPWYAEKCSSTIATTYSSGNGGDLQVTSTDLHDKCTTHHSGTSAAAPMAAGIMALALEANPDLTWRDMQHLIAYTSKAEFLLDTGDFYKNGAGFCVSLAYGFGLMDADYLVSQALNWTNVGPQHICTVNADSSSNLPQKLESGNVVKVQVQTNGCDGTANVVNYLEHVQVILTLDYSKRGAISVILKSPSGTNTTIMLNRKYDRSSKGFQEWPLTTLHNWGEDPNGVWTVEIHDDDDSGSNSGLVKNLTLKMYGTEEAPEYLKNGDPCQLDDLSPSSEDEKKPTEDKDKLVQMKATSDFLANARQQINEPNQQNYFSSMEWT